MSISEEFSAPKVGFALDIGDSKDFRDHKFQVGKRKYKISQWEKKFWKVKLHSKSGVPLYRAHLDTTFALYDKIRFSNSNFYSAVRVAGAFTARHLPWYKDSIVPNEELSYYSATAITSTYSSAFVE
jgi:hypothetical protein